MIPSGMLMICLAFELTSKMIRKYEEKTTTTKTTKQKSFNHALYAYWDNFSTLNTLSRNKLKFRKFNLVPLTFRLHDYYHTSICKITRNGSYWEKFINDPSDHFLKNQILSLTLFTLQTLPQICYFSNITNFTANTFQKVDRNSTKNNFHWSECVLSFHKM